MTHAATERQLPVDCLLRTTHGEHVEYPTSADHPDFVTEESLGDSSLLQPDVVGVPEGSRVHRKLGPKGDPQLVGSYLRWTTAWPVKGAVRVLLAPPDTLPPAVFLPSAGLNHSTSKLPDTPARSIVTAPPEGR